MNVRHRTIALQLAVALSTSMLVVSACAPRRTPVNASTSSAVATTPLARATTLWGYVYRVNGTDTIPARKATVWTDPPSDQVFTDSLGYWEIRDGVVDNRYRVMAKTEGVTGRTALMEIAPGKSVKASVLIGVEETPWPPSLSLDDKAITIRKGPKGTRCCFQ